MSDLERALRELEIATAAVQAISLEDIEGARSILKRRSKAIARLAGFQDAVLALPAEARLEVISRLQSSAKAGETAQRELALSKHGVTAEWLRWNQVHRALGSSGRVGATKIDCRG
jgi:hypothetical protein